MEAANKCHCLCFCRTIRNKMRAWVGAHQFLQDSMCAQRLPRPAYAFAAKIPIRLGECAGWPESSLGANVRRDVFWRFGSYHYENMPFEIQSTLVISNSKRLSETLRDIRTSTYQICGNEKNNKSNSTFTNEYVICLLKLEIYWKYCGKEEKLLLRSNFSSFLQYFVTCC